MPAQSNTPGGRITGALGARATHGGRAVAADLNAMAASGNQIENTADVQAAARRLSEQYGSDTAAARATGIPRETIRNWRRGLLRRMPRGGNLSKLRTAQTAVPHRERRAIRDQVDQGRGARIEVSGADQRGVRTQHRRDLPDQVIRVSPANWSRMLDAWEDDDYDAMDDIWDEALDDAGEYMSYSAVSSARVA